MDGRKQVLEAAIALREFTAAQLTAYTTMHENSVRRILRREQARFETRVERDGTRGRPAVIWRLSAGQCRQALSELAAS